MTETIHLRKEYARQISCGVTGPVRVTETLSEATCLRCQHEGDPVARTRALAVVAAHAEALTENRPARSVPMTNTLSTPELNRLARIAHIDEQITDLLARRAALLDPPFKVGDRVVTADEPQTVWTVGGCDPIDPRLIRLCTGNRDRVNVHASELRLVGGGQ